MWKADRFFTTRKMKTGKAAVLGMYSEKKDKTFDAIILLADTDGK
jgi:DNA topoisomerase-3